MKNRNCAAFTLALLALAVTATKTAAQSVYTPYTFTTLAGTAGSAGSADGTGSAARFNQPIGVAVDSVGNIYVADSANRTIRKVTPAGVVTTMGPRFVSPVGVAVDSAGIVYVADNNTIRKMTPAGVVTTLAGLAGSPGSADGTGSAARFGNFGPIGVAVDSVGNIYVADYGNATIRKVTPGGVVTTVAGLAGNPGNLDGTGNAARFTYPWAVAVDDSENVYVADEYNDKIRKVTPAGVVTSLGGGFNYPHGVAVDHAGNMYVVNDEGPTISQVTPAGVVSTLAGLAGSFVHADGTGSAARFYGPQGMAMDRLGNVYVVDFDSTIRRGFAANAAPVVVSSWPEFGFNGGQFGFNLAGPGGQVVVIEASTNLTNWLPLRTNTFGAGALYFSDPESPIYAIRFYRAYTP